jgi:hypothetical protein
MRRTAWASRPTRTPRSEGPRRTGTLDDCSLLIRRTDRVRSSQQLALAAQFRHIVLMSPARIDDARRSDGSRTYVTEGVDRRRPSHDNTAQTRARSETRRRHLRKNQQLGAFHLENVRRSSLNGGRDVAYGSRTRCSTKRSVTPALERRHPVEVGCHRVIHRKTRTLSTGCSANLAEAP